MSRSKQQAEAKAKMRAWPADAVERWPIDKIVPYERNARTHSDEQIAQIAQSMQRFGVTTPVLVDEQGVLIYGHGRLAGAKLAGFRELPVCIARGWPEEDKKAYRIADNQHALNSGWDLPILKVELSELQLAGFDLPSLGFEDMQLVQYIAGPGENDPSALWTGMPEFSQKERPAFRTLIVHFQDQEAVDTFCEALDVTLTPDTKYIWRPHKEHEASADKRYSSTSEAA